MTKLDTALRWYQSEATAAVWQHMRSGSGAPLIVLPTGSGKSHVIAGLCYEARDWGGRVIVLAPRKELLTQNAEQVQALLPDEPVGIYSAGLNHRNNENDIVCAGIQSVYNKAHQFGRRDVVIVDEAHLIPPDGDGMYQQFIRELQHVCPHAQLVGLTATPYRCGSGPLAGRGRMFGRVCYEVSTGRLIDEGYLCRLTNKTAIHQTDTSGIAVRGGEFVTSSMAAGFGHADEVEAACREVVLRTEARRSVLLFCSGVAHAEQVADRVKRFAGEEWVPVVTGGTPALERAAALSAFRSGGCRFLANCDVLTTGFDHPGIDCVAILRATKSPGLFAQIVGRGLRTSPDTTDCLVLDFGGNLGRHGPLDHPGYGRAEFKGNGNTSEELNGRGKRCPNCEGDVPVQSAECDDCGFVFPRKPKHGATADEDSSIIGDAEPVEWQVESVIGLEHRKKNHEDAPPTLRVMYTCQPCGDDEPGNLGGQTFSEWVCFEHSGFAREKAEMWWNERSDEPVPGTVADALVLFNSCRQPVRITVQPDGRWQRIVSVKFDGGWREEWATAAELEDLPF